MSTLSKSQALMLAENPSSIDQKSISQITDEAATILLENGIYINFTELTSINDITAELLHKGCSYISLDKIIEVPISVAEILTKIPTCEQNEINRKNRNLSLCGLSNLSQDLAKIIAGNQGDLCLNGLKSIDDTVAHELSRHKHTMVLNGITQLSDDSCLNLSKHNGRIMMHELKIASRKGISYLMSNKKIEFNAYRIKKMSLVEWDYPDVLVNKPKFFEGQIAIIYKGLHDLVDDAKWLSERLLGLLDIWPYWEFQMNESHQIYNEFKNIQQQSRGYFVAIHNIKSTFPTLRYEEDGGPSLAEILLDLVESVDGVITSAHLNFQSKSTALFGS